MIGLLGSLALTPLGRIPAGVYFAIAVVIAVGLAAWWHHDKVQDTINTAHAAGLQAGREASDKAWQKRFDDMKVVADEWRTKAETVQSRISQEEQLRYDAENRAIAERADALRLRYPRTGRQACAGTGPDGDPAVPGSTSQPQQKAGRSDATGSGVHPGERSADVPWAWLVKRAEQCDVYRAEAQAWRNWYRKQVDLNAELRRGTVPLK